MSNLPFFFTILRVAIRLVNTRDFRVNLRANNISLKRKNNSLLPCNPKVSLQILTIAA